MKKLIQKTLVLSTFAALPLFAEISETVGQIELSTVQVSPDSVKVVDVVNHDIVFDLTLSFQILPVDGCQRNLAGMDLSVSHYGLHSYTAKAAKSVDQICQAFAMPKTVQQRIVLEKHADQTLFILNNVTYEVSLDGTKVRLYNR